MLEAQAKRALTAVRAEVLMGVARWSLVPLVR